ncbi:hypothetical protein H257_03049 [Aphanomyces astaci]|uniref:Uncharacterized protein n=1 Tax=Aphanomyces astaci TaxID=112090 RepID=W4H004_APHAT|nr:hypothetical protein H257_03049 [Aphanomyces astaci]ETV85237.1 hypothetical protein H257_03049 [Aphanomyces astaci]|eukprot:XP_009825255.1 hypothetical protein H257_03049 [Aphanomyces astaci]
MACPHVLKYTKNWPTPMYTLRRPSMRTTLSAVAFATVQHPSRNVRRPREPRRVFLPADPSTRHVHGFVDHVQPCRSLGMGRDARARHHSVLYFVRPGLVVCRRGVWPSHTPKYYEYFSNDSFCVFGYQSTYINI